MCGLCGYVDFKGSSGSGVLNSMIQTLKHRGPDNFSTSIFPEQQFEVGLAHARLSIIDLSENANQPMHYNHLSTVFNGEIFNFQEIKEELLLLGHRFLLESDTEMILHAYEEWGTACVHKFIGMFAIVIYDKKTNEVILIRDRVGSKPLHYFQSENLFLFGSEIKSVVNHPQFTKKVRYDVLQDYFIYSYIPSNNTIYEGLYKLPSGSIGTYNLGTKKFEIKTYWDVYDYYTSKNRIDIDYKSAKRHVHDLLKSVILYRKVADVPIGVFLSGGYDSSLVAAVLQKEVSTPVKTFTVGFEAGNNEAPFAKAISEYLGTEHYEYYCSSKDAAEIINKIAFHYDEPFADSSAIPTMFVSKKSSEHVKVVISADGGDEVFCGYNQYVAMDRYNRLFSKSKYVNSSILTGTANFVSSLSPVTSFKRRKFLALSRIFKEEDKYKESMLFEGFQTMSIAVLKKLFKEKHPFKSYFKTDVRDFKDTISMCMAIDYKQYLQNDILTKVDRATMAYSIEGREPLTDHRLIEYCARLPLEFKLKEGVKKRILKDIVHQYIPQEMMDRPKAGFSVPIYDWLKGDLSYILDLHLNKDAIDETGIFNTEFVLKIVEDFKNSKLPDETIIWKLLMFQMWFAKWMKN